MSKYRHVCALIFAAILTIPSPAFAWGAKGHQIVALIAEAHLNASTRDKIKAILPKNGTLAKASIWPDEVRKALRRETRFITWRYLGGPRPMTGNAIARSGIASLRRLQGTDVLI